MHDYLSISASGIVNKGSYGPGSNCVMGGRSFLLLACVCNLQQVQDQRTLHFPKLQVLFEARLRGTYGMKEFLGHIR